MFVHTGVRPDGYTINVNARKTNELPDEFINILKNNNLPSVWLVRRVLAEESTYEGAVKRFKTEHIGASIYYIVSGLKPN